MTTADDTRRSAIGALHALERDIFSHWRRRDGEVVALEVMLDDLNGLQAELAAIRASWRDDCEDFRTWLRIVRAVRVHLATSAPGA